VDGFSYDLFSVAESSNAILDFSSADIFSESLIGCELCPAKAWQFSFYLETAGTAGFGSICRNNVYVEGGRLVKNKINVLYSNPFETQDVTVSRHIMDVPETLLAIDSNLPLLCCHIILRTGLLLFSHLVCLGYRSTEIMPEQISRHFWILLRIFPFAFFGLLCHDCSEDER
jgi:hypothetical protein